MRKFWIVMLTVGLMMAFTMPAFGAVGGADVKFSGSYLINGLYASNPSLKKTDTNTNAGSYAVYDQRLRMQADFKVAEGLTLVTRFDALEKKWGDTTWYGTYDSNTRLQIPANTGAYTQENIEFERAYIDFKTGIGQFMVGYQNFTSWGTAVADGNNTKPGIKYIFASGPMTVVAALERNKEGQVRGNRVVTFDGIDSDDDAYDLGFIYKWSGGEAGLLYQYADLKYTRPAAYGSATATLHVLDPYVKMTFGPVYVESEIVWITGKATKYEAPVTTADVDASELGFYIKANVDLKPAYVGAMFLYVQGDDYGSATKKNGGWLAALNAGSVFEPCLIFGSYWYNHAAGITAGGYAATADQYKYFFDNIWFAQGYVGAKPIPKLDVQLNYSWMKADQKPRATKGVAVSTTNKEYVSDAIGQEVDLKVTYKIFDNLSYMVGGAYFFTGDYFKGTNADNKIDDNYLIMHQLNLTF
ncbi:MAG: hypothetical protein NTZ24_16380 [Deltaproteobacteria bacterium]|nr:hypothetical protein [Deltaproteobacteria bacterium]